MGFGHLVNRGEGGVIIANVDMIAGEGFTLRETTPADAELLLRWHKDPQIHRHWERRPLTEQEIADKYLGARAPEVRCFVIESSENRPIGFIQYAHLDSGDVGLDMFLLPGARGGGVGPRVASDLARHLVDSGTARRVTVDPLLSNTRAVRAWEKAGFKEQARIQSGDHGEPAVLMVFRGRAFGRRPPRTRSGRCPGVG
jgi:aminoglycoside 6'-N-acetyltransferase